MLGLGLGNSLPKTSSVSSSVIPGVSGLQAWYKFKTDASSSQWSDQSDNGNNATQSTGADQPSYNSTTGAFGFDISTEFDIGSAFNLDARTIIFALDFAVTKSSGTVNYHVLMHTNGQGINVGNVQAYLPGDYFYSGGNTASLTAIGTSGTITNGTKVLLTYTQTTQDDGGVLKVRKNGTQIATATVSTADGNGQYDRLGRIDQRGFEGNMYEVVIFDEVLSSSDLTAVEDEIMARTGIS
tara:strand:+ start:636 stop:1355 length:720 start_codon:yes stop_codon:yes gene_type:complete